jgi:hypothetical protein
MTFTQIVEPNPNIPCQPGWCLQYVRQTFGASAVEPTATAGWNNAKYRHEDWDFPDNCWVPVWLSLAYEPAGHVALLAPDGSVYSTSDDSPVPHHHPSMADLIAYYWRNPLTYLGWSEDISGVTVVQNISLNLESVDDMPSAQEVASETVKQMMNYQLDRQGGSMGGQLTLAAFLSWSDAAFESLHKENATLRELVSQLAVKQGVTIDYDAIARKVNDDLAERISK